MLPPVFSVGEKGQDETLEQREMVLKTLLFTLSHLIFSFDSLSISV